MLTQKAFKMSNCHGRLFWSALHDGELSEGCRQEQWEINNKRKSRLRLVHSTQTYTTTLYVLKITYKRWTEWHSGFWPLLPRSRLHTSRCRSHVPFAPPLHWEKREIRQAARSDGRRGPWRWWAPIRPGRPWWVCTIRWLAEVSQRPCSPKWLARCEPPRYQWGGWWWWAGRSSSWPTRRLQRQTDRHPWDQLSKKRRKTRLVPWWKQWTD